VSGMSGSSDVQRVGFFVIPLLLVHDLAIVCMGRSRALKRRIKAQSSPNANHHVNAVSHHSPGTSRRVGIVG